MNIVATFSRLERQREGKSKEYLKKKSLISEAQKNVFPYLESSTTSCIIIEVKS